MAFKGRESTTPKSINLSVAFTGSDNINILFLFKWSVFVNNLWKILNNNLLWPKDRNMEEEDRESEEEKYREEEDRESEEEKYREEEDKESEEEKEGQWRQGQVGE